MGDVSVFIRVRPNVAQTRNDPHSVKQRFEAALSNRDGLTNLSFPPPRQLGGSHEHLGHTNRPEDEGERPLEADVSKDGPAVDVRFDWDDLKTDEFLHSEEWLDVTGPLTRAPFVTVIPR